MLRCVTPGGGVHHVAALLHERGRRGSDATPFFLPANCVAGVSLGGGDDAPAVQHPDCVLGSYTQPGGVLSRRHAVVLLRNDGVLGIHNGGRSGMWVRGAARAARVCASRTGGERPAATSDHARPR